MLRDMAHTHRQYRFLHRRQNVYLLPWVTAARRRRIEDLLFLLGWGPVSAFIAAGVLVFGISKLFGI